jgi:enoyl-[acyl-carrier protein] reductase I
MAFLQDKKILITGLLSNRSIAYGIARAAHREGAQLAFTYQGEDIRERVERLAADFGKNPVLPCDVTQDDQIDALFSSLKQEWGHMDGLVHSIAFAPREALKGEFLDGLTRDAFKMAHDISS